MQASRFLDVGQSGVMFVGNASTQPTQACVIDNVMVGIGQMLASAGGVYVSSASNVLVARNNISGCTRWGIAVRSNRDAPSQNITIVGNRVRNTGLATSDFGAISMIDHTADHSAAGNVVRANCVHDTWGVRDGEWRGEFGKLVHTMGRGLYLDDFTSNTLVEGNVFVRSSASAVFTHSGSNNRLVNNVFVNASGPQLLWKDITKMPGAMQGNELHQNVIIARAPAGATINDEGILNGAVEVGSPLPSCMPPSGTHHNCYYRPGAVLSNPVHKTLFFDHSWSEWQGLGYDQGSLVDVDPGFVDAAGGDYRLTPASALHAIGFKPLETPLCGESHST